MELNATLMYRLDLTPDLMIIRVQPDGGIFEFEAGQYTVLGLPGSAKRCAYASEEDPPAPTRKLIRRAYSIGSGSKQRDYLEFYIALVRSGELTPRLCALSVGDRLWLGPKATGHFILADVPEDKNLLLISTGTGLAPYISMIRDAHRCHEGRVFTVVHGARNAWDLGYRGELEALNHGCGTFHYIPTITRPEPREKWNGHVGRIQSVFEDSTATVNLKHDHVFLCGNPEMVDHMQNVFTNQGFEIHRSKSPGNLHVERFW